MNLDEGINLRKHPFLHALRRWGRFARRNVCAKRPRGEERGETDVFPGYEGIYKKIYFVAPFIRD